MESGIVDGKADAWIRAIADINSLIIWRAAPDGTPLADCDWPEPAEPAEPASASEAWIESLHPDDRAAVRSRWRHAFASGEAFQSSYRLLQADGSFRWALGRGVPLKAAGLISEWVGTVTDIEESVRSAYDLNLSEERLRLALESNDVGIWDHDLLTDKTWTSDKAAAIVGRSGGGPSSKQELLGFVHADDLEAVRATFTRALAEPESDRLEASFRAAAADGAADRWIAYSARVFFDPAGRPTRVLGTLRDVTEEHRRSAQILHEAQHDQLTGLPSWQFFADQADETIAAGHPAALLLLGLLDYPMLSDREGLLAGRDLLLQVAQRLASALPAPMLLSRVGSEFVVLAPQSGLAEVERVQAAIHTSLTRPFTVAGQMVAMAVNLGVALAPDDGLKAAKLLTAANLALQEARRVAPGVAAFYRPRLKEIAEEKQALLAELRQAVDLGQFELHYQPQLRLADRRMVGAEALLRWRHPRRGLLRPAAFLDDLEKSAMALEMGDWIIRSACKSGSMLQSLGKPLRIAVNLFPIQFKVGDIAAGIEAMLGESGLAPKRLEIEITERIVLEADEGIAGSLRALREHGCSIALDDFGTGYASLGVLKNLPLSRLKIDRQFVRGIEASKGDGAIVDAVVTLARSFGLAVTAEGIETDGQAAIMRQKGCEDGQGYLFGRPMPFDDLVAGLA